MIMFDTNMILRYLLNDDKEMADAAEKYIDSAEVIVTIEVIAEVVYVLNGVYSMERTVIADTLKDFLKLVGCREPDVVYCAFDLFGRQRLDFIDCILYGYHAVKGIEIATFDRKLLKLLDK